MKKEKVVKQYTRKTKSGKSVIVKQHSAKYDSAEDMAKEAIKNKKGSGEEFTKKKKEAIQLEIPFDENKKESEKPVEEKPAAKKEKVSTKKSTQVKKASVSPEISASDFKEWYKGTGSAADKATEKALRKKLGKTAYSKLEDEAIDNYSSRGHLSMFKKIGSSSSEKPKSSTATSKVSATPTKIKPIKEDNWRKSSDTPLRKKGDMAVGSINVGKRSIDFEVRPTDKGYEVSMYDRKGNIGHIGNTHITTLSDLSKHVKNEVNPKRKLTSTLLDSGEIDYGATRVTSKKLESQKVSR